MKIVHRFEGGRCYAWVFDRPDIRRGRGYSPDEAVGNMYRENAELFGISLEQLPAGGD